MNNNKNVVLMQVHLNAPGNPLKWTISPANGQGYLCRGGGTQGAPELPGAILGETKGEIERMCEQQGWAIVEG